LTSDKKTQANQKNNNRKLTILLAISWLLFLGVLAFFLITKTPIRKISDCNESNLQNEEFLTRLDAVIKEIADLRVIFSGRSWNIFSENSQMITGVNYDFFWKSDEGFVVSTHVGKKIVLKQSVTNEEKDEYNRWYSFPVNTYKNIFESNGFAYNPGNSMDSNLCGKKSLAFEKGDLKCLLLFEPNKKDNTDSDLTMISLNCSDGISEALTNQKEALERLDKPKGTYISSYSYNGLSSCKKITLQLGELSHCGGSAASFINYQGTWTKLGEGHTGPTCEELSSQKIPAECIDYTCWSNGLNKDIDYREFLKKLLSKLFPQTDSKPKKATYIHPIGFSFKTSPKEMRRDFLSIDSIFTVNTNQLYYLA